jgi:hypothetical protein
LATSFAQSGLSPEKVSESASAVIDYIGEQGNDESKSLLAQVLE